MILYDALHWIFGYFINLNPLWGLVFVTFVMTLFVTLCYKYFTNQELMKSLKNEMKTLRDEAKKYSGDMDKLKQHNSQMWEKQMVMMKQSLKPMFITLIPFFIIFAWLKQVYDGTELSFLGITSWFWIYIIFSIVFSLVLRKLLRVH